MTLTEQDRLFELWSAQWNEWRGIRDDLISQGRAPTAYDVTIEQRRRALAEGRKLTTYSLERRALVEVTPSEIGR